MSMFAFGFLIGAAPTFAATLVWIWTRPNESPMDDDPMRFREGGLL